MFVPDDIWVWENFEENQLDHMRPRQRVTLEIDAYPERTIRRSRRQYSARVALRSRCRR